MLTLFSCYRLLISVTYHVYVFWGQSDFQFSNSFLFSSFCHSYETHDASDCVNDFPGSQRAKAAITLPFGQYS